MNAHPPRYRLSFVGGIPLRANSVGPADAQLLILAHCTHRSVFVRSTCTDYGYWAYVLEVCPLGLRYWCDGRQLDPDTGEFLGPWDEQLITALARALTPTTPQGVPA